MSRLSGLYIILLLRGKVYNYDAENVKDMKKYLREIHIYIEIPALYEANEKGAKIIKSLIKIPCIVNLVLGHSRERKLLRRIGHE